jgi:hypothetical protein
VRQEIECFGIGSRYKCPGIHVSIIADTNAIPVYSPGGISVIRGPVPSFHCSESVQPLIFRETKRLSPLNKVILSRLDRLGGCAPHDSIVR